MKKRKFMGILPLLMILVVTCLLLLTELFRLDSIMADPSMETQNVKNGFELIPFFWTVGIVGGCIGLTLVYVSWRKYKAEEEKKVEKGTKEKSEL